MKSIIVISLLVPLLLTNLYRGKILSFFSISIAEAPIDSVGELLTYPGPIASYRNWLKDQFAYVQGPVYDKLSEKLVPAFYHHDELGKADTGKYVLVDSRSSLEYGIRKRFVDNYGQTHMHIMKECWQFVPIGLMLKRNSPLTERVNRVLFNLIEGGFISKWKRDEMDKVQRVEVFKLKTVNSGNLQLSVEHFQYILIFLFCGLAASSAGFFLEHILSKLKSTNSKA